MDILLFCALMGYADQPYTVECIPDWQKRRPC
jgi:hypothetical protein